MRAYNVEVFSSRFDFITAFTVSDVEYSFDYLNLGANNIQIITDSAIMNGDYIHISSGGDEYFGVICGVSQGEEEGTVQIEYKSFLSIFNTDILFDTNRQGIGTLEEQLKAIIDSLWVNNSDATQNILGLQVATTTTTLNWGFNLKSDIAEKHHIICNFYTTFIVRSMEKYGVGIRVVPDFTTKKIYLSIGYISDNPIYIEADLPNIIKKNVTVRVTQFDTNKLIIWNATADYGESIIYYRHTDDTYDIYNRDRISPVITQTVAVQSDENHTFSQLAESQASETFGSIEYNNLIELSVLPDDILINPKLLQFGQKVVVISNGSEYNSMLTGVRIQEGLYTLIFGILRIDLTKILQRRQRWQ